MAKDARALLNSYETELVKKLVAEQTAYQLQAQVEARARREQAFANLEQERIERSRAMALDFLDGKRGVARWQEPVRDYARKDYEIQRGFLLEDMNGQMQFLARIQTLEVDKQKISALKQAFGALAEKPTLTEQAEQLASFAKDTSSEFDKQLCANLASQLKEKTAEIASLTIEADKNKANVALNALKAMKSSKGCQ
jgi:hypothetical protein